MWQRAYGPQCLKYLLSSHLQKKFANPGCTLNRLLFFFVGLGTPFPSPISNNASWKNAFSTCNRWTWNPPSSWAGDCLCLLVFFVPSAVPGAGEEASSLLTMTKGCINNPQAHWTFLCNLCIPEVLKVLIPAGFALPVTLLSKPRAPCPAYFLSSGAA